MKTKSVVRMISQLLLTVLVGATTTACVPTTRLHCQFKSSSPSENSPVQVAAVLVPTNNFVDFQSIIDASETSVQRDLGEDLPKGQISDAIGRELSLVLGDGVPSLVVKKSVDPEGNSDMDIRREVTSSFSSFRVVAKCAAGDFKVKGDELATSEETDILSAIAIAADQFTQDDAAHKLYVLSNGIQTAGSIKMQQRGYFPKSEKLASELARSLRDLGQLPDLTGVEVFWYGLGQVDGENQVLNQKARDSLISFWRQVITFSGGTLSEENIFGQIGTGSPHEKAIPVTAIDVRTCNVLSLYEEDGLAFKPDTSDFIDRKQAKVAASKVAQQFAQGECDSMTITGFAAAGVDKKKYESKKSTIDSINAELTLSRAKAFAALVREAGYEGEISTAGAGTCGTEWKEGGKADKAQQKLCRRVEVKN